MITLQYYIHYLLYNCTTMHVFPPSRGMVPVLGVRPRAGTGNNDKFVLKMKIHYFTEARSSIVQFKEEWQ